MSAGRFREGWCEARVNVYPHSGTFIASGSNVVVELGLWLTMTVISVLRWITRVVPSRHRIPKSVFAVFWHLDNQLISTRISRAKILDHTDWHSSPKYKLETRGLEIESRAVLHGDMGEAWVDSKRT